ncbi:dynein associated protein-domain-containing protein [Fimicolochytrium jonesii]|uniref:dynein associated protein-domain-containing protein n=1 Tax=Fimicolochytrium jonesii TaxID=1396493 RepID=UPI0022FEECAC|nr:dynein associated protein-domain-containing protein [Fimicolochytrium jonesii]KAI8817169.1 dynein associated protein-domain-containing protein [Fimicolochytrium jonesii]
MADPASSSPTSPAPSEPDDPASLPALGSHVHVSAGPGIVRYAGLTAFAPGSWVGLELQEPNGKNDGSVQGKRYFDCPPNYGVFVRPSQVRGDHLGSPRVGGNGEGAVQATPLPRTRPASAPTRTITPPTSRLSISRAPMSATTTTNTTTGRPSSASVSRPPSSLGGPPPSSSTVGTRSRKPSLTRASTTTAATTAAGGASSSHVRSPINTPTSSGATSPKLRRSTISPVGSTGYVAPTTTARRTSKVGVGAERSSVTRVAGGGAAAERTSITRPAVGEAERPSRRSIGAERASVTRVAAAVKHASSSSTPYTASPPDTPSAEIEAVPHTLSAVIESTHALNLIQQSRSESPSVMSEDVVLEDVGVDEMSSADNKGPVVDVEKQDTVVEQDKAEETVPSASVPPMPAEGWAESRAPSDRRLSFSASQVPASPAKFSQLVPLRDLEELRIKLTHLELKSAQDREKLVELERMRVELDATTTAKHKLSEKLQEVQSEVSGLRRSVRDAHDERDRANAQVLEVQENMEIMLLDKEMAEERAESLQAEVRILEERVEELSLDLEVLKQERELDLDQGTARDEGGGGLAAAESVSANPTQPRTAEQISQTQLERQNERLKEALIKLRDVSFQEESNLKSRITALEEEVAELEAYKDQYAKATEELLAAESAVDELKAMMDDSLGVEDMVGALTERNMALNEKLEDAKAVIRDLEALRELNDQLEEDHIETENLLQEEIEVKEAVVVEQRARLAAMEDALADSDRTIQQFRELVRTLQGDLENLGPAVQDGGADAAEVDSAGDRNLNSQSQAMIKLQLQLQSTQAKAHARSVELELRKLEVEQANLHLSILTPYLPETFFQTDHSSIAALLLFKRMQFKALLLARWVDESAHVPTGDTDHLAVALHVLSYLAQVSGLSSQLATHIETAAPADFESFGKIPTHLAGVEMKLDVVLEQLQKDAPVDGAVVEATRAVLVRLERVAESVLVDAQLGARTRHARVTATLATMARDAERVGVNLDRIDGILTVQPNDGDITDEVSTSLQAARGTALQDWETLRTNAKQATTLRKKLARKIEDMAQRDGGGWTLTREPYEVLTAVAGDTANLAECTARIASQTLTYVLNCRETQSPITIETLARISKDAVEQLFARPEPDFAAVVKNVSAALPQQFSRIDQLLDNADTAWTPCPPQPPPWHARAALCKKDYTLNTTTQTQLSHLTAELTALLVATKQKDVALAESQLKIELMEKRVADSRRHADVISGLREELSGVGEKARVYEEAVESLHADLQALETENEKLRRVVRRLDRGGGSNTASTGAASPSKHVGSPLRSGGGSEADLREPRGGGEEAVFQREMYAQLTSLKAAVGYLRAENARLKAGKANASAAVLFGRGDPLMRRGLEVVKGGGAAVSAEPDAETKPGTARPHAGDVEEPPQQQQPQHRLTHLARTLLRDTTLHLATPRVVNVSTLPPASSRTWTSWKTDPRVQRAEGEEVRRGLVERAGWLRGVGGDGDVVGDSGKVSRGRQQQREQQWRIGKVTVRDINATSTSTTVPANLSSATNRPRCVVLNSRREFEALHAVFA